MARFLIVAVILSALALAAPAQAHRRHHHHWRHHTTTGHKTNGAIHFDGPDTSTPAHH